jgi:hypothetical protein
MTIKILKPHFAYGSALLIAAASGAFFASVSEAYAQSADTAIVAKSDVTLVSDVMVERVSTDKMGREVTTLKSPKDVVVVPGDKLVLRLHYQNKGDAPAKDFRATNPMPGAVEFIAVMEDWAEISVDGGVKWGKLSDFTVNVPGTATSPATTRPADAKDVSHVRWSFATPLAPGAKGTVSFRGVIK